jgi:HTH-type transcriptional regulator / antitoxin HigA
MQPWYPIQSLEEYEAATGRYEEIRETKKGEPNHREKMLLVKLISDYEEGQWTLPEVDPIEMIKIRMEDFGYKPADLAKAYGDKGTVSKVLHYKQPLSLNMIRVFSKLLRISADALIKEYPLHNG